MPDLMSHTAALILYLTVMVPAALLALAHYFYSAFKGE